MGCIKKRALFCVSSLTPAKPFFWFDFSADDVIRFPLALKEVGSRKKATEIICTLRIGYKPMWMKFPFIKLKTREWVETVFGNNAKPFWLVRNLINLPNDQYMLSIFLEINNCLQSFFPKFHVGKELTKFLWSLHWTWPQNLQCIEAWPRWGPCCRSSGGSRAHRCAKQPPCRRRTSSA